MRIRIQPTKMNGYPCWSGSGSPILIISNKMAKGFCFLNFFIQYYNSVIWTFIHSFAEGPPFAYSSNCHIFFYAWKSSRVKNKDDIQKRSCYLRLPEYIAGCISSISLQRKIYYYIFHFSIFSLLKILVLEKDTNWYLFLLWLWCFQNLLVSCCKKSNTIVFASRKYPRISFGKPIVTIFCFSIGTKQIFFTYILNYLETISAHTEILL